MGGEEKSVRPSAPPVHARRLLLSLLVLPLVAISFGAYLVLSEGSGGGVPVAQGASGGVFHPIAGEFVADDTSLTGCGADNACLEQAFGNISFREGPRVALDIFEQRLDTDPVVEKGCHRIAHFIGSAALERFNGNVAKTFSQGSPACVSGYYHGILERAFLGISSKAGLARAARELCAADGLRRRGFLDYQCRHGLGHGLMIQTGYDLPLALEICAGLETGWDHKACAGGAFMENINTQFGFRSPWLDDVDPLYPCGRVQEHDQRSCYLRASWRILVLAGGSFATTAETCAGLGRWARTCFHGFGRDAAENARYSPARIRPLCRLGGAAEGDCLYGAARTITNASGHSGVEPARRLCAGAPPRHQAACFEGIGQVLGLLHAAPTARRSACLRVAGRHVEACAAAAEREVDPGGRAAWG